MDTRDQSKVDVEARDAAYLREVAEHVVGRASRSWEKWWDYASANPCKLRTALIGALLSLGAPPHPCFLTQDLTDIILSTAPPRRTGDDMVRFNQWKDVVDRQWRRQHPYNSCLNHFAVEQGLVYTHATHDPAQFRKLFAAFLDLHACKVKEKAREQTNER